MFNQKLGEQIEAISKWTISMQPCHNFPTNFPLALHMYICVCVLLWNSTNCLEFSIQSYTNYFASNESESIVLFPCSFSLFIFIRKQKGQITNRQADTQAQALVQELGWNTEIEM